MYYINFFTFLFFTMVIGLVSCSSDDSKVDVVDDPIDQKAVMQLSVESLSFGEVEIGNKNELSFTVSNSGNALLSITSVSLTGTDKSEFTTTATSKNIEAGASETFKITLSPTTAGDKTASLELATNVGAKTIALTGKGKETGVSVMSLSTYDLKYGEVFLGETAIKEVTLSNTGTATMNVSDLIIRTPNTGIFSVVNAQSVKTVSPGKSVKIKVAYKAVKNTAKVGTLEVVTDASNPSYRFVALEGDTKESVFFDTGRLVFPEVNLSNNTSASFAMRNESSEDVQVSNVYFDGYDKDHFGLDATTPGTFTLAAGQSRTINVKFTPFSRGVKNATIKFQANTGEYVVFLQGISR